MLPSSGLRARRGNDIDVELRPREDSNFRHMVQETK